MDYIVKDPQGNSHVIQGPEGATPEQVIAKAKSLIPNPGMAKPAPSYWKDVVSNAGKEAPVMALGTMQAGSDLLGATSLFEAMKSAGQMVGGTPLSDTATAQHLGGVRDIVKSIPSQLFGVAKTAGKTLASPVEYLSGTDLAETMIGQQFRQNPLGTTFDLASLIPVVKGVSGAVKTIDAGSMLENSGIRGMNQTAGMYSPTIDDMATRTQNPGRFGVELGKKMAEEGAIGRTATATFDNASKLVDKFGKSVDESLKAIKAQNRRFGEYPELSDALKQPANQILKPLIDQANKFSQSQYPLERFEGKYHRAAYNSLAEKANKNNGFIRFDDIRSEMQRVGEMMGTASEENYKVLSRIYRKLATIRNTMVEDVAASSLRPELAKNLLDANAGYSRYMDVLPDIRRAAAKESIGVPSLSFHQAVLKKIEPIISEGMYKAGKFLKRRQ